MKQRNFVLQLAVASVLSMPMMGTFAADMLSGSTGIDIGRANSSLKPLVFASEQPIESTGNVINMNKRLVVNIPTIEGYKANSDNPMFIKVALKGGIKFANASKLGLVCKGQTADGVSHVYTANIQTPAVDGGTVITFQIKNGVRLTGTSGLCAMAVMSGTTAASANAANYTWYKGLTKTAQSVSALITYYVGVDKATKSVQGSIITFAQAGFDSVSQKNNPGTTAAKVVIDVRNSSQKFSGYKNATQAFLGSLKYKTTAGISLSNTSGSVSVSTILKTATVTLEGASFAAAQGVSLFDGTITDACGGSEIKGTISGTTITFNNVTPAKINAGLNVCMTVSGKTAIPSGQITATFGGTPQTGWIPIFSGAKDLFNLKKNGLSFRVLNIPPNPSTSTTGDTGFVRLYNVNNFATTVLGTMYNEQGQIISTAGLELAKLEANQVKALKVEDLQTLFGTWTGRARLLIDVDAAEFKVVSTVRSPTGVLLNLSSETSN